MSTQSKVVRRTATVFMAIGMLVMSSGIAIMVGVGPANAATKVNVCHATSSDTNPYVFIQVDDDSTKLQGHLMHREDPNKRWKSDGEWNGSPHAKGDPKPDLIGDYVDEEQVPHTYDGNISEASCEAEVTEIETSASVSFTDPTCANDNVASFAVEGEHVDFTNDVEPVPGASVTVTATVQDGYTFADDAQSLLFEHTFAEAEEPCEAVTPPDDDPDPQTIPDPLPPTTATPTVVHAGLTSGVQNGHVQQGLALLLAGMIVTVMAGGLGMVRPRGGKS